MTEAQPTHLEKILHFRMQVTGLNAFPASMLSAQKVRIGMSRSSSLTSFYSAHLNADPRFAT